MKHKKIIYEKMKQRHFGENMSNETKLEVLNFVERQLRLYNAGNRYSIEDIEKCVEHCINAIVVQQSLVLLI
jgi:hypothetical protein